MKIFFIASFFLLFSNTTYATKQLPQELRYENNPIHPYCITATQFGDSSRFEPQSVNCIKKEDVNEFGDKLSTEELNFNPETNTVISKINVKSDLYDEVLHDQYQYLGTHQDRIIIFSTHYSLPSTGRFVSLGLIERQGDKLVNVGEITGGDRAYGGSLEVLSIEKNKLKFRTIVTPATLVNAIHVTNTPTSDSSDTHFNNLENEFPSMLTDLPDNAVSEAMWFYYDVDLDNLDATDKPYKIAFLDNDYYEDNATENDDLACFYQLALETINTGKQQLDVKEYEAFITQLWACILN